MTNQELFDKVATRIIMQGGPAYNVQGGKTSGCRYRAANGRVCAAGSLILDEYYDASYEGKAVPSVHDRVRSTTEQLLLDAVLRSGVTTEQLLLVRRLQQAHDYKAGDLENGEWLADWRKGMLEVAEEYRLSMATLEHNLSAKGYN